MTDWPTDRLTDWLTEWLTECLADGLTDWLTEQQTDSSSFFMWGRSSQVWKPNAKRTFLHPIWMYPWALIGNDEHLLMMEKIKKSFTHLAIHHVKVVWCCWPFIRKFGVRLREKVRDVMIHFNLFNLKRMKNIYIYNACAHIYITCGCLFNNYDLQSFYHHLGSIPSQNEMSSDVSRGKTKHAHAHIMPRHPRNMASVHGI